MTYFNRELDHINLQVPNLEDAVKFYTEVMGFKIVNRYHGNDKDFVFITDGNITYELIGNKDIKETIIQHIAYTSKDIKADYEYFKKLDLITMELKQLDFLYENGVKIFFIKGPDGKKIEFVQRL